ncbi:MAG: hypothetical protein NTX50_31555 [Candidatus Sumerlaeota bacterium]|nr:hypothetical protein [Candidatus Sumerlaeota bacterium]
MVLRGIGIAAPVQSAVLALMAFSVLLAGGCSVRSIKPYSFEGIQFPDDDRVIASRLWQVKSADVNSSATEKEVVWAQWRHGALPFGFGFKELSVMPPQSMALYGDLTWHDLCPFCPFVFTFPLWVKAEESVYRSPSTQPSGSRSFLWTPVSASVASSGELKDTCSARCIPLLYSHIEMKGKEGIEKLYRMKATNFLWSLGPMRLKTNHIPGDTLGIQESDLFVPLFLCTHFSMFIWSDFAARSKDPNDPDVEQRISAHGPLGGAVWLSYERLDASDPKLNSSKHGALWGMFGWGQKDGRRVIRVCGISL